MRLLAFGDRAQEDHPHIDEVGLLRRARGVGGSPGRRGGDQPQKDCTRGSGGGGRQRPPRRRARAVRRQEPRHSSGLAASPWARPSTADLISASKRPRASISSLWLTTDTFSTWTSKLLLGTGSISARMVRPRSEEHTSELQSLMRISYAVFCLKKKNNNRKHNNRITNI